MTYIYGIGQDVGLSTTVLDDTGAPAAAAEVVLTVTAPDGSTSTPTTMPTGTAGGYGAVVPNLALAGVYLYRWTATGSGFDWSAEGQFQAAEEGAQQVVDLPSVKAHLNLTTVDQARDDELLGFIYAASELVRDIVGPVVPETRTEYFDGGSGTVVVAWQPLVSVVSVTEYYGLSAFPLTEQQLGEQMNAFAFTVDRITGQLMRRTFGGQAAMFAIGDKNVKVTYTAGRSTVPWSVRLGALELIRHNWQMTQQSGRKSFRSAGAVYDGDAHIPSGFAMPDRVIELLAPHRRPPGIA